jgi:hypothetical protein
LDGNVYAAGYSIGSDSSIYFTVISLTDEGDENWVFRYPSSDIYIFRPEDIIVYGLDNNIYAAGKCSLPGQSEDFFVVSLSTTGDTNWTYHLNGRANEDDFANAIIYGSDGNIYAAGMVQDVTSGQDFAVVSLTADGTENWVYTYSALPYYRWDEAFSIDRGADGNIYAAGENSSTGGFWDRNFTVVSIETGTGVEEIVADHRQLISLEATPNPFTNQTHIRYMIDEAFQSTSRPAGRVSEYQKPDLNIYDATGRLVKSFYHESSIVNRESVVRWGGLDNYGGPLPAGVYFIHLQCSKGTQSLPVVLQR